MGRVRQILPLLDQGISSASNILFVIVIARAVGAEDFGRFSVAYSVVLLLLGLTRSLYGTRITLGESEDEYRRIAGAVLGGLIIISPLISALVLLGGSLLAGRIDLLVVLVAVAAPIICIQDIARYASLALNRPKAALLSDTVWLLLIGAGLLLPLAARAAVPILWLVSVTAAAVVALGCLRIEIGWRAGLRELVVWSPIAASMAWGTVLALGTNLVVAASTSAVLGPSAAGALRGANTLLGPVNVLLAFINIGVTAKLARRNRQGDLRFGFATSSALVGAAIGWSIVLLLLPDQWGRAALGDTWSETSVVLPVIALQYVLMAATAGSTLILKVRKRARAIAGQKTALCVLTLGLLWFALFTRAGVSSVAWALVASALLGFFLGWLNVVGPPRRKRRTSAST